MWMLPYKNGSAGAGDLAKELGIKQIKREGSKFKGAKEKLVVNWGSSTSTPEVEKCEMLNKPEAVAIATNKLNWFTHITRKNNEGEHGYCEIPRYWTTLRTSRDYIAAGHKVVCRQVLTGHSGQGIVIASTVDELVDAPLYVEYRAKKREYRVHVLFGEVVDVQRKARNHDVPDDQVNWLIRNNNNGFVYVRDEEISSIPREVLRQAVTAVKMTGLDFGAVDVIYNEAQNFVTVLEINTAPGLVGTTLEGYKQRLTEFGEAYKKAMGTSKRGRVSLADEVVPAAADPFRVAMDAVIENARRLNEEAGIPRDWLAQLPARQVAPRAPRGLR